MLNLLSFFVVPFMKRATTIKPFIAEPVLTAAIQNRLKSRPALLFTGKLAQLVILKVIILSVTLASGY